MGNFNLKNVDDNIKRFFSKLDLYFKSLNKLEKIAWGLIGLGFVLVILGIIFI